MNLNEYVRSYYEAAGNYVYANPVPLDPKDTALVLIDVQNDLTRDYFEAKWKSEGLNMEELQPVLEELGIYMGKALSNIGKVLSKCREKGIRPIHVKIESYLEDAADTGRLHASAGMFYPPGNPDTGFHEIAKPLPGEITLKKTCSGAHIGTPIDRIMRNLGIKTVLVVGFYTDQCVSTTVRDLSDLGYQTEIIEDAMAAFSPERHDMAMNSIRKIYANSGTTEELLMRLEKL
jgi:nicotinamidase-related amidase